MFPWSLGRGLVRAGVAAAVVAGVQVGEVPLLCPVVSPRVLTIRWGQQQGRTLIMGGQQVVRGRAVIHQVMGRTGGTESGRPGQKVRVSVHLKQEIKISKSIGDTWRDWKITGEHWGQMKGLFVVTKESPQLG